MVKKQSQADVRFLHSSRQKGDLVYSVQRALSVLNLVAEHPQGLSAREISTRLCLHISTCYHVLNTLLASGYLDRHPYRQVYLLGPQIPFLNNAFVQSLAKQEDVTVVGSTGEILTTAYTCTTLINRIRPILYRLTQQTQEPSYMACWRYGEIVLQAIVEAPQVAKITKLYVGYRDQAHSHALGKVLLAYSDPAFVNSYLDSHPLTASGPNTIMQRSRFIAELNDIVCQGYAIDREELLPDTCCIAAPIFAPQGQIVAALAISLTTNSLAKRAEWLIAQVTDAANHARAELRVASISQNSSTSQVAGKFVDGGATG
ncbi:MAG TPA: IclR family transcriptional regulator [Ktedonobacteraceae bacterium]|nr:IclR family transcriptional regulator [Ktedonobacteraceae bacterium]